MKPITEIVDLIDKKLLRLREYATKKALSTDEVKNLLNSEFNKSCLMFDITEQDYLNVVINR